MWHPSRPKILAFKYKLTQVGKKGNFLRIKSVFVFLFLGVSEKSVLCKCGPQRGIHLALGLHVPSGAPCPSPLSL